MIDSSTFTSLLGDADHLKLHAPSTTCPFKASVSKSLTNFHSLNVAFQQATGWELQIFEPEFSFKRRVSAKDPKIPAVAQLKICDLSPLFPPGIPAASRIYCEKLVEEFNQVLQSLTEQQRSNYQSGTTSQAAPVDSTSGDTQLDLPTNIPFETSSLAVAPLSVEQDQAVCEWFVQNDGTVRFATIVCFNRDQPCTQELMACRSAFLTECRHEASNHEIQASLNHLLQRVFPGGTYAYAAIGSLDPLTGDLELTCTDQFLLHGTMPEPSLQNFGQKQLRTHLPRGHHLMISCWPASLDVDEVSQWCEKSITSLRGLRPYLLPETFQAQLRNSIPSLPANPLSALTLSRY